MRRFVLIIGLILAVNSAFSQKVDSIYFNLYTDSLKKGFFNYISVDGKLSNGQWAPLDTSTVRLISDAGFFKGNDLFIDSAYKGETVKIKAILRSNPHVWKETIIYIRKRGFNEPLKSSEDILNEIQSKGKKSKG